jgi:hypothetical protein
VERLLEAIRESEEKGGKRRDIDIDLLYVSTAGLLGSEKSWAVQTTFATRFDILFPGYHTPRVQRSFLVMINGG